MNMTDTTDFDGLAAVKSCDTYLLELNSDGVLVESFDCGRNWNKAKFTGRVCGWLKDALSPVSRDVRSYAG